MWLPHPNNILRMCGFKVDLEGAQRLPFPLNGVLWLSHVLGGSRHRPMADGPQGDLSNRPRSVHEQMMPHDSQPSSRMMPGLGKGKPDES